MSTKHVVIPHRGFIEPLCKSGPINLPIHVSDEKCKELLDLNLTVRQLDESTNSYSELTASDLSIDDTVDTAEPDDVTE